MGKIEPFTSDGGYADCIKEAVNRLNALMRNGSIERDFLITLIHSKGADYVGGEHRYYPVVSVKVSKAL